MVVPLVLNSDYLISGLKKAHSFAISHRKDFSAKKNDPQR